MGDFSVFHLLILQNNNKKKENTNLRPNKTQIMKAPATAPRYSTFRSTIEELKSKVYHQRTSETTSSSTTTASSESDETAEHQRGKKSATADYLEQEALGLF